MSTNPTQLATELLLGKSDTLEEIRVYQFEDHAASQDDRLQGRMAREFNNAFDHLKAELTIAFGQPVRTGAESNAVIPLCGVLRFAIWEVQGKLLYAAAAHEDRECPYLLTLGVANEGST